MDFLAMLVSLIALYVSVLTLMKRKSSFVIKSSACLLAFIFFKPLFLWVVAGGALEVFHTQCIISVVIIAVLLLASHGKLSTLLGTFGIEALLGSAPLLTYFFHWLVGEKWMNSMFLSEDLSAFIQVLSSEYKITFETFRVMTAHSTLTLFFLLVVYQLTLLTVALFCTIFDLKYRFSSEKNPNYRFMCSRYSFRLIVGLLLLSTNILVSFLSTLLSYFI